MSTQQAAFLAALGTAAMVVVTYLLPLVLFPWGGILRLLPLVLAEAISLPLFFFCAYRSKPPIAIPERLRKPALAAAIATCLSAAWTVFDHVFFFITSWRRGSTLLWENPARWLWEYVVVQLIALLAAIAVPLFFLVLSKNVSDAARAALLLRRTAIFACLAMTAWLGYWIYFQTRNEVFAWTHRSLLTQGARPPGSWLWFRMLRHGSTLFLLGSLSLFFFLFYRNVPATQPGEETSGVE